MSEAARAATGHGTAAWHAVGPTETIERLKTDPVAGLDSGEVSRRLAEYGPNRLPEGKRRGPLMRFSAQLNNILVYVLLAAGFVKLMVGLWLDAGVILGVVVINALLGFIQEGKAEKALDSDPEHALRRGPDHTRRRHPSDLGRGIGPGRRRAARIG